MSEFPELPETGDPDPAGDLDVPSEAFLTVGEALADPTVDVDENDG